jgi:hypothetical protein
VRLKPTAGRQETAAGSGTVAAVRTDADTDALVDRGADTDALVDTGADADAAGAIPVAVAPSAAQARTAAIVREPNTRGDEGRAERSVMTSLGQR